MHGYPGDQHHDTEIWGDVTEDPRIARADRRMQTYGEGAEVSAPGCASGNSARYGMTIVLCGVALAGIVLALYASLA